jgi:hypothetical protein
MASESQTTVSPSFSQGTRPEGEIPRKSLGLPGVKRCSTSPNSMPQARISSQGRSDQEE